MLTLSREGYEIAKLDSITGAITILTDINNVANKSILAVAYIAGTNPSAESVVTKVLIEFDVVTLNKIQTDAPVDLYVGDQEYNLAQHAYFVLAGGKKNPDFEIELLTDSQNLGYVYSENTTTKEIHITKDGKTYAKIKFDADGNRSILQTTSSLDSLTIKLHGYLKVSSSDYTLESLKTNYVELELNIININVNFGVFVFEDGSEQRLSTISANGKEYYVLDSSVDYTLSPAISNGKTNLSLSELVYSQTEDLFIGKVNEEIALSFVKTLQKLSRTNSKTLTLPNGNGAINIASDGNNFKFSKPNTNMLVDYVFVSLDYTVEVFSGTVNICLKPDLNITFEFDDEDTNFASVYSPSSYKLSTSGNLLNFNKELLTGKQININDVAYSFDIEFSGTQISSNKPADGLTYAQTESRNHNLILSENVSTGYNISISKKGSIGGDCYYGMKVILTHVKESSIVEECYYYYIRVTDIEVKVAQNGENITSENPVVAKESTAINLKQFIFVNSNTSPIQQGDEFFDNIIFTEIDNASYSLSSDGIFTPKVDAFDVTEIQFSLFNVSYSIFVKGQELSVEFRLEGEVKTDNYAFVNGETYYIYLQSESTEEGKKIVVDVKNLLVSGIMPNVSLNIKIKSYYFAGSEYTDEAVFDVLTEENKQTFSFMGNVLLVLTKLDSCYKLEIASELNGALAFELSPIYASLKDSKTCNVLSDVLISVNYVEPSVFENQNYQNVLAGSTYNLSNIVSINKNDVTLTYSIISGANAFVSIDGSNILASQSLQNDVYLKIKVNYNSITNYVYVRVIPKTKTFVMNNQSSFDCIQNEKIDLFDYVKINKFAGFDSKNEPIYALLTEYKQKNADETESLIEDLRNFVIDGNKQVVVNGLVYNFKATTLLIDDISTFVGERVDLKEYLQGVINRSSLASKDAKIEFAENQNVDENGIFVANTANSNVQINVLINGVEHIVVINVEDLVISVQYSNSILIQDDDSYQSKRYENFNALKSESLSKYITISGGDEVSRLQFAVTVYKSVKDATDKNYDITKFTTTNSTSCGKNTIVLNYDGQSVFAIGQDKIECYENLKYETLLNISISLDGNTIVKNDFNVRLLPIEINYVSEKELTNANFVDGKYNLCDIFSVTTKAVANNVNLNGSIEFYNTSVQESSKIENGSFQLSAEMASQTAIIALFGGKTYQLKLNYTNEGDSSTSVFVSSLTNATSCFVATEQTVSVVGVTDAHDGMGNVSVFTTSTVVVEGGKIYYDVFDENLQRLLRIDTNGMITNRASKNFSVKLLAKTDKFLEEAVYVSSVSNEQKIELLPQNLDGTKAKYVKDNGVYVLEMISCVEVDLQGFLNGASLKDASSNSNFVGGAVELSLTGENYVKALNVEQITYGYFDIYKNDLISRVYVKVYPYLLAKSTDDDFTFKGASVLAGTKTLISQNDTFKTIYAHSEDGTICESVEVDLNNFVKKISQILLELPVSFEIDRVVAYNQITSAYSMISSNESDKNTYADFVKLVGNKLKLFANGTYYVYLTSKTENSSLNFALRILQVKNNSKSNFVVDNNSYVYINSLVNVKAICQDKTHSGGEDINLQNNLEFGLSNNINSYVEGNVLFVQEKDAGSQMKLKYSYKNLLSSVVEISVNATSKTYLGNYPYLIMDGKQYQERWYDSENVTNISENISQIKKVTIDGVEQSFVLESGEYTFKGIKFNGLHYNISNLVLIVCQEPTSDQTEVLLNVGDVLFFDSSTNEFVLENKIGIICLTTLSETNEVYRELNYKLNNYAISFESGEYKLSKNGEAIKNSLKFDLLMMDENQNFVNIIALNDQTILFVSGNDSISANGITLFTKTGSVVGTKLVSGIRMFVKVYIFETNLQNSQNYVLFEVL
ncbi:MAG: hypothetical protein ACI4TI_03250 [Christensenellales bacterium]